MPDYGGEQRPSVEANKALTLDMIRAASMEDEKLSKALSVAEKCAANGQPMALAQLLHRVARQRMLDQYVDPSSGLKVFTANFLAKGSCCGNGCRHCPHGHVNVPAHKKKVSDIENLHAAFNAPCRGG
mmetsp:Transcript_10667/g.19361  ORF Transcript_10667/g.19361 Transcript_10667/m.19361 type:complete len:128 (-) Transcript_10667:98-481(-)